MSDRAGVKRTGLYGEIDRVAGLLAEVEAERDALRVAAADADAEKVMGRHIYPKPDVPPDHPFAVLCRLRAALARPAAEKEARANG
ncbi:hypothetical protein [Citreimonas salinaria]|uniref:Uncharacterized protein n=1 Tax=Citreimonas salinaria TaxID=321339 RepID=A0A1H3KRR4_9RHOB|nr:hypothetical protein [Citreimonas salinaria]SDY54801.1 hypothetical protein SAMN05444340_11067 [Citreimonas salinaria]